jgi:uncharacterized protein (TIGR02646 family)
MKYIQKSEILPPDFHKWLIYHAKIIEEKIQAYEKGTIKRSEEVWSLFRSPEKDLFRTALWKEQGAICAYCGSIIGDNTHVRLDHIIPKSLKIKDVFDYYNLVAACSGGEYVWHTVLQGETADAVAQKYGTDVSTIQRLNPNMRIETGALSIQTLNPHLSFEMGIAIEVKIAVAARWTHCDVKKGDTQHDIKPTDFDCQTKFGYLKNNGEIIAISHLLEANQTIEVLGLNTPLLKEKRLKMLFRINAFVKNIQKIAPSRLKDAIINKKQQLYSNPEKLPEMVFVTEYFLDSYLKT